MAMLVMVMVMCGGSVFGAEAAEEASYFWHVVAGTGILGTIVTAIVKIVLTYLKPMIDAWVSSHKLTVAYDIIYDAVRGCYDLYTKE